MKKQVGQKMLEMGRAYYRSEVYAVYVLSLINSYEHMAEVPCTSMVEGTSNVPDHVEEPKNGTPQNEPITSFGETRGFIGGGSFVLDPLGVLDLNPRP